MRVNGRWQESVYQLRKLSFLSNYIDFAAVEFKLHKILGYYAGQKWSLIQIISPECIIFILCTIKRQGLFKLWILDGSWDIWNYGKFSIKTNFVSKIFPLLPLNFIRRSSHLIEMMRPDGGSGGRIIFACFEKFHPNECLHIRGQFIVK